jgi:hypothetical protein
MRLSNCNVIACNIHRNIIPHFKHQGVKEQRNILQEVNKRGSNWIGHVLCRNGLLRQVIEGKIKGGIDVTGRRERRRRKLLDYQWKGYSHLKEEALYHAMWRVRFGRYFGPVVRQTAK